MLVATLHGIGLAGLGGYASNFFRILQVLASAEPRGPVFSKQELTWRSWMGPLSYWLLDHEGFMRRAQEGIARVAKYSDEPVILVTHSAGCRIAYDWFNHNSRDTFAAWITCGANKEVLDGVGIPLGFKPAHLPRWVHCYREGDPLGGPLGSYGAIDKVLPLGLLRDHVGFWDDGIFAREVMREMRSARC